ncbi:MAG: hypothetical protein ABSG05_03565 [Candidatus Pacearchaeota archaeon]|jgi:hypothetical protein
MNKKGSILSKFIVTVLILLALAILIFGIPYKTVVNGTHTGIITAVETTGIFFKTVTVYVKTSAFSSQEDQYCLKNQSLIPMLQQYETSAENVTVTFDSYLWNGYLHCGDESAVVTGVLK